MNAKTITLKKKIKIKWIVVLSIVVIAALIFTIRLVFFKPFLVEGQSMAPTIRDSERILVDKAVKWTGGFHRGDIIVIHDKMSGRSFVKRLIGLPGDSIKMKNDQLYINDKKVEEPYLKEQKQEVEKSGGTLTGDFEVEVPSGKYFVMGDNRLNSLDSRNGMGMPSEEDIIGTESLVFYPFGEMRQAK
ncbi:signal peptidase I [Bacillus stercoris]|uniref:signal peptidase I sipU n=1 Tax=Bacillus TaxID=1386 RepID=UPI0002597494|nr:MULTISPECIES: signal peptidase I [unclassified Bacillus (in: firmicutes)]TII14029.1 signal peptidase I [Bacillus subtilis]BEV38985.1 signal peptidase I [Bacillus stercoris]AFI26957.1 type I signal peptidase [Bacillus sp. JS]BBA72222.1 type I signal peptidase [Bacillus sp. FW1]GFM15382.1 type I signal peptidase [Bacillus sp. FW1]